MTHHDPTSVGTPEEVLEAEIEDLEKRTLNSGRLWALAALGLVVVAGGGMMVGTWTSRLDPGRQPAFAPETMRLTEPYGTVDDAGLFRWEATDAAASYVVTVKAATRNEYQIVRSVTESFLKPSETELADLTPGDYLWSVEARSRAGTPIGYGEGRFSIREPGSR